MALESFAQDASIVLALLLLEAVLSFDNAAILAAMVRRLPIQDRKKALLYGLVGAYALRFAAILLASFLIANPILKVIGGGYLVFIGLKHFYGMLRHKPHEHKEHDLKTGFLTRMGVPALVAVIIQIELVDLAFAIDQVIVAVAFTDKVYLIVLASFIGILFLRLAAAMIARVMDWLPLLEHMAYIAVTYVGVKLILLYEPPFLEGYHAVHIPTPISIGVTLALFVLPVFVKLVFKVPRSIATGTHVAAATAEPPKHPLEPERLQEAHADVKNAPREIDGVPQPRPGQPPQPPQPPPPPQP
jgi:YkoY family integral membrane protein